MAFGKSPKPVFFLFVAGLVIKIQSYNISLENSGRRRPGGLIIQIVSIVAFSKYLLFLLSKRSYGLFPLLERSILGEI
jgi:hypothetical protein